MLNKNQVAELRKAVGLVDFDKAIQDAKDMGIEVTKKELGYHGIYSESGILEKVNMNKHFRIGDNTKRVEINRNSKNETFSYIFKKEEAKKASPIETDKLLVV